jgi:hypothetical protein
MNGVSGHDMLSGLLDVLRGGRVSLPGVRQEGGRGLHGGMDRLPAWASNVQADQISRAVEGPPGTHLASR